jgi:hypothetical protein
MNANRIPAFVAWSRSFRAFGVVLAFAIGAVLMTPVTARATFADNLLCASSLTNEIVAARLRDGVSDALAVVELKMSPDANASAATQEAYANLLASAKANVAAAATNVEKLAAIAERDCNKARSDQTQTMVKDPEGVQYCEPVAAAVGICDVPVGNGEFGGPLCRGAWAFADADHPTFADPVTQQLAAITILAQDCPTHQYTVVAVIPGYTPPPTCSPGTYWSKNTITGCIPCRAKDSSIPACKATPVVVAAPPVVVAPPVILHPPVHNTCHPPPVVVATPPVVVAPPVILHPPVHNTCHPASTPGVTNGGTAALPQHPGNTAPGVANGGTAALPQHPSNTTPGVSNGGTVALPQHPGNTARLTPSGGDRRTANLGHTATTQPRNVHSNSPSHVRSGFGGNRRVASAGHPGGFGHGGGGGFHMVGGHGGGFGHGGGGGHRSDIALKEDIAPIGRLDNGLAFYRFRYRGGDGTVYVGVMAQEVQTIMPEAVTRGSDGYLQVDYDRIGAPFMTWKQWLARRGSRAY